MKLQIFAALLLLTQITEASCPGRKSEPLDPSLVKFEYRTVHPGTAAQGNLITIILPSKITEPAPHIVRESVPSIFSDAILYDVRLVKISKGNWRKVDVSLRVFEENNLSVAYVFLSKDELPLYGIEITYTHEDKYCTRYYRIIPLAKPVEPAIERAKQ